MKLKDKGELIRNTYRVKRFSPLYRAFFITLIYWIVNIPDHPPFALFMPWMHAPWFQKERWKTPFRDDDVFFPIRDAFIEKVYSIKCTVGWRGHSSLFT